MDKLTDKEAREISETNRMINSPVHDDVDLKHPASDPIRADSIEPSDIEDAATLYDSGVLNASPPQ